MTRHPNSDGRANLLKSQGENSANPLIENQARAAVAGPIAIALVIIATTLIEVASTPRGGGRAEEGLPPSERPFSLSGQPRSEK